MVRNPEDRVRERGGNTYYKWRISLPEIGKCLSRARQVSRTACERLLRIASHLLVYSLEQLFQLTGVGELLFSAQPVPAQR